jgi:hypothetical protein
MPTAPRRQVGPVRHQPTPPPPPTAPSPPANGGNGEPTNGENDHSNTITADQIYADGMNGIEALAYVLGPDNLTGNNQADAKAAMQAIADFLANLDTLRSVILHVMFNDYARRGDRRAAHQRNNWAWVASQIRQPIATVAKWAHRVETYDALDTENDHS